MTDYRDITNPPSDDDPIIAIANDIARWRDRIDELDEVFVRGDSNSPFTVEESELCSRVFAAQDKLSELKAQSVEAAIVQLGAANSIFHDITENDVPAGHLLAAITRYRRLMYSAIPVLCDALGVDQDGLALPHFFEPYLDPWNRSRADGGNVIRLPESH